MNEHESPWLYAQQTFGQVRELGFSQSSPLVQLGKLVMVLLILSGAALETVWVAILVVSSIVLVLSVAIALLKLELARQAEVDEQAGQIEYTTTETTYYWS